MADYDKPFESGRTVQRPFYVCREQIGSEHVMNITLCQREGKVSQKVSTEHQN